MRSCLCLALIIGAASLAMPAMAQNYPVKDATGATQTMASKLNGGVNFPEHVVTDPSGAHALIVTAAGAAMVDGSAVTQPVSGSVSLAGALPGFTSEPTLKLDQTGANNGVQVENPVAVTGTFWQSTQPVSGAFWQATQPISAAALPLPTGAASAALQPALNGDGGGLAHVTNFPSSQTVTGTFWQATQPVSGTFWQTTQPVSIAALPALAAGSAVIGHVIVDTAPTTAVTGAFWQSTQPVSLATAPALVASSAIIGKVGIDQTTPGTTNGTQDAADGATGSAPPAKAAYAGVNSSGALTGLIQADKSAAINVSTATTTQLVALSSGKAIYIAHWDVVVGAADNVTLEYGTGTNCGTGTTALSGAYNFAANGGISAGFGLGPVLVVPASNALCILTSAAAQASGAVSYTQF